MSITKTFGRNDTNDVVISKLDIGGNHAKITYDGKENFYVEDLDSLNCTYVNGQPVQTATITLNDQVRLSKDTILNLKKIFGLDSDIPEVKKNPKDFTKEFEALQKVFEDYEIKKKKVVRNSQLQRAGISLSAPLIWVLLPGDVKANWQGNYILLSGLFVAAGNIFIGNNTEQTELFKNFQMSYVCPFCFSSLGSFSWEYWERKGNCPTCQVIYSKNKL